MRETKSQRRPALSGGFVQIKELTQPLFGRGSKVQNTGKVLLNIVEPKVEAVTINFNQGIFLRNSQTWTQTSLHLFILSLYTNPTYPIFIVVLNSLHSKREVGI